MTFTPVMYWKKVVLFDESKSSKLTFVVLAALLSPHTQGLYYCTPYVIMSLNRENLYIRIPASFFDLVLLVQRQPGTRTTTCWASQLLTAGKLLKQIFFFHCETFFLPRVKSAITNITCARCTYTTATTVQTSSQYIVVDMFSIFRRSWKQ